MLKRKIRELQFSKCPIVQKKETKRVRMMIRNQANSIGSISLGLSTLNLKLRKGSNVRDLEGERDSRWVSDPFRIRPNKGNFSRKLLLDSSDLDTCRRFGLVRGELDGFKWEHFKSILERDETCPDSRSGILVGRLEVEVAVEAEVEFEKGDKI